MSDTLTTLIRLVLKAVHTKDLDLADPRSTLDLTLENSLASVTGSGQADVIFHDRRTISAGGSEALDLAGALTDQYGATVTFVKIKAMIFRNANTSGAGVLAVGGAAANQFVNWVADSSDIVNIQATGILLLTAPLAGFAVTAGTGDQLKVAASGADVTYDVVLIGTSA